MKAKINNIPTKKRYCNKLLIIVTLVIIFVAAIGIVWALNPNLITRLMDTNHYDYELRYNDIHTPNSSYYIQIDTKTKALLVKVQSSCDAINCNASTNEYGPTILTNEEYTKIFSTIKDGDDMEFIAPILESIARDREPFDTNTTQRELANQWLDDVIKELHK